MITTARSTLETRARTGRADLFTTSTAIAGAVSLILFAGAVPDAAAGGYTSYGSGGARGAGSTSGYRSGRSGYGGGQSGRATRSSTSAVGYSARGAKRGATYRESRGERGAPGTGYGVGQSVRGGRASEYGGVSTDRYHYGGYGYASDYHTYGRDLLRRPLHRGGVYHTSYGPSDSGVRHYYPLIPDGYGRGYGVYAPGHRPYPYSRRGLPYGYGYGYGVYGFTIRVPRYVGPRGAEARVAPLDEVAASGWALLAEDRPDEALSVFARAAAAWPEAGSPKAGYAIAQALQGDLPTAVWAMRRALSLDPTSLDYLSIDEALRPRIETLIARFEATLRGTPTQALDGAFMVAALSYIVHDRDRTRVAAERVIELGDDSGSAGNLLRMVDDADRSIPY